MLKAIIGPSSAIQNIRLEEILLQIIKNNKITSNTLGHVATVISLSNTPIANADEMLLQILNDKRLDGEMLGSVAIAIVFSKKSIAKADKMFLQILNHINQESYLFFC